MSETKNITIVNPASGDSEDSTAYDLTIRPGVTAGQVLQQVGLPDYQLAREGGEPMDNSDELFPSIRSGEKLIATTGGTFGRKGR